MTEIQMGIWGRETGGGGLLPASVEEHPFASVSLLPSPEFYYARGDLSIGHTPDGLMAGCARPGYVELAGSWSFDATPNPSVVCDNGTVPLTVTPRQLHAVTVSSDNQAQAADLTDPTGVAHHYAYTFDAHGALASKVEAPNTQHLDTLTTSYSYDVFGNLRSVGLPDGHTITYAMDAAQRRVGKAIDGTLVQGFLYQSAVQPVAELDGDGQVRSFFVYADKPNVPEYMIRPADTEHLSAHSYRIITDHLGSVRLVVDAADGTIMQRMDYDEHGNVLFDYVAQDFERVPFGYAGGLYDPDTGIVRFGEEAEGRSSECSEFGMSPQL